MTNQIIRILPEVILTIFGTLIMVADPLVRRKTVLASMAIVGLVLALAGAVYQTGYSGLGFNNQITNDTFAIFFRILFIFIGILIVFASPEYLERDNIHHGEYYALILMSIVGQCFMACSVELIMIFIGLEISSISTYILAGIRPKQPRSTEAALKYFLLGSFATAFLLYGIALIFGATGSTQLIDIRNALPGSPARGLGAVAAALMFVGFGFKVAAAPFHIWTPDVYEGAPTPVTAFMSAGPKAAAFAVFLRVFLNALMPATGWFWLLWVSAVLSMFFGNLAALLQTNIKRMLAYSSIAHAGYIMVAFTARSAAPDGSGAAAVLFYLAAYCAMNIGAFIVVSHFGAAGERLTGIQDFAGLARRQPGLAAVLSVFLLSLIGIPLTGGFFGKFYIFRASLNAHLVWLTVLGVINSAIAAYYYLRVIVIMYMQEPAPETADAPMHLPATVKFVLAVSVIATIYLGVFPGGVLEFATSASPLIR